MAKRKGTKSSSNNKDKEKKLKKDEKKQGEEKNMDIDSEITEGDNETKNSDMPSEGREEKETKSQAKVEVEEITEIHQVGINNPRNEVKVIIQPTEIIEREANTHEVIIVERCDSKDVMKNEFETLLEDATDSQLCNFHEQDLTKRDLAENQKLDLNIPTIGDEKVSKILNQLSNMNRVIMDAKRDLATIRLKINNSLKSKS